ncbi:hypothetical protein AMS68_004383 [Peltaster fructicola]|uniref:UBR-type domain-containing protein n=1 Tax=Peltaster fructicola TaxID=286661 RepID=A0A6H0XW07_9PEZI|nr:hypothetical protein AMS68_004383 [Peltaster fructicola]
MSQLSEQSHTASDYIESQLRLEEDAREALPYQFDTCTKPLGSLRQSVFACLTCTPSPATSHQQFTPAGVCYSCSISCHGDHNLVELFTKRNFVCDCGTTRYGNSRTPCNLRLNATTGRKGEVVDEEPASSNTYDQNYAGKFCGCGEGYDPEKEKGTMFQCLGLGSIKDDGCGEDWWHPECLMGLPRQENTNKDKPAHGNALETVKEESEDRPAAQIGGRSALEEDPLPAGFPSEDDFDHLICYKCVSANPWIKQYAGTSGFLPALLHETQHVRSNSVNELASGRKRKAEDEAGDMQNKKARSTSVEDTAQAIATPSTKLEGATALHETLPLATSAEISLLLKEDFRDHFCRCPTCFPRLARMPQLLEEEESYEPPISESEDQDEQQSVTGRSVNSGSLLERGEAALSSMDRVRAIEGVMAYNHVRDKVKEFLAPFAESGKAVGAEDIKAYFAQLRGDEQQSG